MIKETKKIKEEVAIEVKHQSYCNYYKFPGCRSMRCHPCNCEVYIIKPNKTHSLSSSQG